MKLIKKTTRIAFLFWAVLFSQVSSAQQLMRVINYPQLYSDDLKVGKLHEFESFFQYNEQAVKHFKKFNRNRKAQRIINYTTLGIAGGAFVSGGIILTTDFDDRGIITLGIWFSGAVLSGLNLGIGNLIAGTAKKRNKNKLLQKNDLTGKEYQQKKKYLAINQYGIGIGIQF